MASHIIVWDIMIRLWNYIPKYRKEKWDSFNASQQTSNNDTTKRYYSTDESPSLNDACFNYTKVISCYAITMIYRDIGLLFNKKYKDKIRSLFTMRHILFVDNKTSIYYMSFNIHLKNDGVYTDGKNFYVDLNRYMFKQFDIIKGHCLLKDLFDLVLKNNYMDNIIDASLPYREKLKYDKVITMAK